VAPGIQQGGQRFARYTVSIAGLAAAVLRRPLLLYRAMLANLRMRELSISWPLVRLLSFDRTM
jgi:hypothetical protein